MDLVYGIYMTLLVINKIFVNASRDIEVWLNDSASIGCSPHVPMDIQWHHTGHMKRREYAYAGRKFYSPYKGRLQIANYSLLIPSVNSDDAGLYECSEEISGRQLNSVHLTVLESIPVCGSNMKSHGYVGPNTCNLEQEDMTFTCVVSYNGKPPQMIWTTLNNSQAFNESTCKTENGRINCSLNLKADPKYDGSIFTCQSTKSSANCSTEIIKIQYFENHLHLVEKNISEKVNCSVKSNQILQFKWTKWQGNEYVTVVKDQTLLIQSPGSYRCIVEYRIRNNNCSANRTEVSVLNPSISHSETGQEGTAKVIVPWLIVVIFVVAGIIILAIVLYRFLSKKSKRRRKSNVSGRKNSDEELSTLNKDDEPVNTSVAEEQAINNVKREKIDNEIESHAICIRRLYNKLLSSLTRIPEIVAEMDEKGQISDIELERLQSHQDTPVKASKELLSLLISSSVEVYESFLESLRVTKQEHVYMLLTTSSFKTDLNTISEHSILIRRNFSFLIESFDFENNVFERLYEKEVLSQREYEQISNKEDRFRKSEALLSLISRKSDNDFTVFKEALQDSNLGWILEELHICHPEKQSQPTIALSEDKQENEPIHRGRDNNAPEQIRRNASSVEINLTPQMTIKSLRKEDSSVEILIKHDKSVNRLPTFLYSFHDDELQKEIFTKKAMVQKQMEKSNDQMHFDDIDELENNLHKTREFLKEIIDVDFGLIEQLRAKGVLNRREIEDIKVKATRISRNSLLLEIISTKKKITQLCEALKDTGQQHIVNYLKACGVYSPEFVDDWPLTQRDISILERHCELLDVTFDTTKFNILLNSNEATSRRYQDVISSKSTSKKRQEALLEILRRSSLRSYYQTIECLRESNPNLFAEIPEPRKAIVPVHATLETDNLNETETQIVDEVTNLLLNWNVSAQETNRLLNAVQLTMAVTCERR